MYKVKLNDRYIGMTERPIYIRQGQNGYFIHATEREATGIVLDGTPYHLLGRKPIAGLETVMLERNDTGSLLREADQSISDLRNDLASTDDTAIELYETTLALEAVRQEQDDALIALYEQIGG